MLINYLNQEITLDQNQLLIYQKLLELADLLAKNAGNNCWLNFFANKKNTRYRHKNLYIYGEVGRGKTMLMKNFYDVQKIDQKVYFHFNDFTKKIHENLRDLRAEKKEYPDELLEVAKRMVKDAKLLCLDEFQAIDIADAMMLSRIFTFLFKQNIIIIFTSNCHPLELYGNGLAKELFLEFINNILLQECEIVSLDGLCDYRSLITNDSFDISAFAAMTNEAGVTIEETGITGENQIYLLDNQKNNDKIKKIIAAITDNQPLIPRSIELWQRKIIIPQSYKNIAIINFVDLCIANLGANDYQAICQNFDLIFLLQIPDFNKENNDELRRFILLIDEVYENKTALIMSAAVAIDDLGAEVLKATKSNLKAFKRTISRLKEISSSRYFQTTKLFKQIKDV